MKIQGVTDEELAQLSDEERAALEEGQQQEEGEAKDLKTIADGGDDDDKEDGPGDEEDEDGDEDDDAKAARETAEAAAKAEAEAKTKREEELKAMSVEDRAAAEAEDKAAEEAAAKAKAEAEAKAKAEAEAKAKAGEEDDADEVESESLRPRLPRYEVKPVEKYEEKIKEIDTALAEAEAKFTAGDIELPVLLATQRKLEGQRFELREANLRAELATEYNEKASKTEWMGDVQDFFAHVKDADGIDYKKPLLNAAFDSAIKSLAANKENAQHTSQWFLREADKQVKAEIGFVAKPADKAAEEAAVKAAAEKAAKGKPAGRKPSLAVVKDIGKLPNAGEEDAAGGNPEFAALDKLEGIEFEDALARMPQSKQDTYLRQRA